MADELSYVAIDPYSLFKSRTGGIIARLLTRTGLDWVSARMFAPTRELAETYAQEVERDHASQDTVLGGLMGNYARLNLAPNEVTRKPNRLLVLVFKGPQAVARIGQAVGDFKPLARSAETIRDTYGDYVLGPTGEIRYFEPAVFAPVSGEGARRQLELLARYSVTCSGLLRNALVYPPGTEPERTLVLIKPDNFRFPSGRPGSLIDLFSKAGLYIVGMKVQKMSVAQAEEFYAPIKENLKVKIGETVAARARELVESALPYHLNDSVQIEMARILAPVVGEQHFDNLVRFMAGKSAKECGQEDRALPGTEKSIAVVYEGPDAVRKIREVLGPTDPAQAPPGSIRREFGQNIMVNAAHASDSIANAEREIKIIDVAENTFKTLIENFYTK
jgi:nucleoside diphosphate kinase